MQGRFVSCVTRARRLSAWHRTRSPTWATYRQRPHQLRPRCRARGRAPRRGAAGAGFAVMTGPQDTGRWRSPRQGLRQGDARRRPARAGRRRYGRHRQHRTGRAGHDYTNQRLARIGGARPDRCRDTALIRYAQAVLDRAMFLSVAVRRCRHRSRVGSPLRLRCVEERADEALGARSGCVPDSPRPPVALRRRARRRERWVLGRVALLTHLSVMVSGRSCCVRCVRTSR